MVVASKSMIHGSPFSIRPPNAIIMVPFFSISDVEDDDEMDNIF